MCLKLVSGAEIYKMIMIWFAPVFQQVFMWEANMFLAGVHAQDQYRDLRLDIDHMSYEVCIFFIVLP